MANSVHFDGTNDYLNRGADFTGASNSKLWSGSFWFALNFDTGRFEAFNFGLVSGARRYTVVWLGGSDDKIYFLGWNASGTEILRVTTSAISDSDLHHVMWSFDMADTGKRHLYVDGSSDLNVVTYTNDTIDFTCDDHYVGSSLIFVNFLYTGDLAEYWHGPGQYLDLSQESNRAKFYGAAGCAPDLGSDGSTPTGTAPILYLTGATAGWHTNAGSGGGLTENGALTDGTNDPTDCAAGVTISAPATAQSIVIPTPAISSGASVRPDVVAQLLAVIVPAVKGGASVQPDVVAQVVAALAPDIKGGASVRPDAVAITIDPLVPAVQISAVVAAPVTTLEIVVPNAAIAAQVAAVVEGIYKLHKGKGVSIGKGVSEIGVKTGDKEVSDISNPEDVFTQ